jgi:hypothetical protein
MQREATRFVPGTHTQTDMDSTSSKSRTRSRETRTLERTVAFLDKRDGIDKVLKIIRYSCKLATSILSPSDGLQHSLGLLEQSLGTSRKAYRAGKFLKNVSALTRQNPYRLVPSISSYVLDVCVNVGEGVYYFIDQFQFLVRIGVLSGQFGKQCTKVSAVAELLGYGANTVLNVLRLHNLLEREIALIAELKRRKKKCDQTGQEFDHTDDINKALLLEIAQLRKRRMLRTLCLVQDAADALLAIYDLRDAYGRGGDHPGKTKMRKITLAAAGLLSGCIGALKRWPKAH